MSLLGGVGTHLADEIRSSGDPRQHAKDLIATMLREKLHWVVQQIDNPADLPSVSYLHEGSALYGWGAVGTWGENAEPTLQLDRAAMTGARVHLASIENATLEAKWTDAHLDRMVSMFNAGHYGCIITEATWGRDAAKAKRWHDRGFVLFPEADLTGNPNAKISAMLDLARVLGWEAKHTHVITYFTGLTDATYYSAEINQTAGRWSEWRYGDITQADWETIRMWPRPTTDEPMPKPTPAPVDPYDKLEDLVNVIRPNNPRIAACFDEVIVQMRRIEA